MRLPLCALLALALASCSDGPAAPTPEDVSGHWTGTNVAVSLVLHLSQSGTTVTGQGDFEDGGSFGSLSVKDGFANSVDVSMNFTSAGGPTRFEGRVETATRMVGTLYFPANRRYLNFPLTR